MTPDCPRLRTQIATFRAMYTHLGKRAIREMTRWHWCPDCPDAKPLPRLPRDPQERP